MKTLKNVICTVLIGLALVAQLVSPTQAYADEGKHKHKGEHHHSTASETTEEAAPTGVPRATHTPIARTAEPTEVPTETPTEVVNTEEPVATEEPIATNTSATDATEPGKVPSESTATEEPVAQTALTETANTTATEVLQQPAATEQTTVPPVLEQVPTQTNVVVLDENGQPLPLASQDAAVMIAASDPVWCPAGQAPTPGANGCTISYTTLAALVAVEANTVAANGMIWITTGNVPDASAVTIDGSTYTNWSNYALTLQGGWDGISGSTTIGSNSVFSGPLTITNWNNGITIQNVDAPSIALSNVTSSSGNGISIDYANSNVSLDNITVTGATGTGLSVNTTGTITANNLTANGNAFAGVYLAGTSGVTLNGTNAFSNNPNGGLLVSSDGNITLNNVIANGNGFFGGYLLGISGATLNGTNEFNNNAQGGLLVLSDGNTTLNNVTANGNGFYGAYLEGTSGVTLNGTNEFSNNADGGLIVSSDGNITLKNVIANGNRFYGAYLLGASGVTLNGTNEFNNNTTYGLESFSDGNITMNQVTATGNSVTDVLVFTPGNATINNATASSLDATAVCGTLALNQVSASNISYPTSGEHTFYDTFTGNSTTINCIPRVYVNGRLLYGELPVVPAQYEFDLSCDSQTLYPVDLPNGDKVTIVCPVSGKALISRLDNTTIPNDLPASYTYASAFSVAIIQDDKPIPVITEGGHVEVSFQVPSQQAGTYSILFWDNGTWLPLNDFILAPDNNPQSFDLNPGIATDLRKILSGVKLVTKNGVQRVEVSTNFPGVFALALH